MKTHFYSWTWSCKNFSLLSCYSLPISTNPIKLKSRQPNKLLNFQSRAAWLCQKAFIGQGPIGVFFSPQIFHAQFCWRLTFSPTLLAILAWTFWHQISTIWSCQWTSASVVWILETTSSLKVRSWHFIGMKNCGGLGLDQ